MRRKILSFAAKLNKFIIFVKMLWSYAITFNNAYLAIGEEIFRRYGIKLFRSNKIIRLWNGLKFEIRPGTWDIWILHEIFKRKVYTPDFIKLTEVGVVIDIGAYIGDFSIYIANKYKRVKIFAYEPSPSNYLLLKKNVLINGYEDRIKCIPFAIDGKKQILSLKWSEGEHVRNKKVNEEITAGDKEIMCQAITLKDIFIDNNLHKCDLLKIDCEGAEYNIFSNLQIEDLHSVEQVAMEYHIYDESHDPEKIENILRKAGFSVKRQIENQYAGMIYARKQ